MPEQKKKAGVYQLPVSAGDRICPDLSSLVPMGVGQTIAGAQPKLILEPVMVRCLEGACAQWDDTRSRCGKIALSPAGA